jgi:hypothetical protein
MESLEYKKILLLSISKRIIIYNNIKYLFY